MGFGIFIPARFDSARLPGKVLLKINNKTLLQYAYETAVKADPSYIVIAVDNDEVAKVASGLGAKVVFTSPDCANGTARISNAILDNNNKFNFNDDDIIVNLQADEILMPKEYMQLVANNLKINKDASIATLAKPIKTLDVLLNPNVVKVVKNNQNLAMYFSRAPIPYVRGGFTDLTVKIYNYWHHIGLYAYKVAFLKKYNDLIVTEFELAEKLEQLRALVNGYNVHVAEVADLPTCDINTQEDLDKARVMIDYLVNNKGGIFDCNKTIKIR